MRVHCEERNGVDGGFTEDDTVVVYVGYREEAEVLARAGSHAAPGQCAGSAEFGSGGDAMFSPHEEHGICVGVGVEVAGFYEEFEYRGVEFTFIAKVMPHARKPVRVRCRQFELRVTGGGSGRGKGGCMAGEAA